ncbi:alpha/beta fold hydrolase [Rhodococcus sp. BP-349]|uniref:alpha/beta fold hydrolase n=1 Tax=unclassified Rhodococcus (in: high G+C Gram-positive bacteria) TaxID=192944 RepID=UPI001C9BBC9C|nr:MULTISPECIES: alpha/beta fold hydrolase [unclassified Rhodococcus (in: high G+C Gram-positive bacteria)]MBY6538972.1 alpha/beta fold hydrolase [Rhodococcus sp. BP-363]MBY6543309.1 alpha/beta fold hydrolase [Rhodococcus sp. BP-369]MBY6562539.1 alpha/beta fold hydrolase [Rhodococcus sp. BP-370]MBY6576831.1 alpha/beta fold hydrolase [Rhodococcus sp. BP-364]MBY6586132.1 alpha/beta fold hydrolase [Rhodococcus sp. BP-358]
MPTTSDFPATATDADDVAVYGPASGTVVLAIHGMTGHGRRWHRWSEHLPGARVVAPDLVGHGRAPWTPPWSIERQVDRLAAILRAHSTVPVVVVGHSYGGALAIHLARSYPSLVAGLVLLDPAIGLPPQSMLETAQSTVLYDDYTDAAEARSEKLHGAWSDVDPALVDEEIAEHLVDTDRGRVRWRTSTAAVVASWGELARPFALPPSDIPVTVARAARVDPPYLTPDFRDALVRSSPDVRIVDLDCDHMVPQAKGPESAALVDEMIRRVTTS